MQDFDLTTADENTLVKAILEAEKQTSGELRIHIEDNSKKDPMKRAKVVFKMLKMHKTALKNGVLFYISKAQKSFVVLGDKGIDKVVPDDFWEEVKNEVIAHFKKEDYVAGLEKGVLMAGTQLKKYFPYQKDDVNELSNEISKG